jgi:hypothetical protein
VREVRAAYKGLNIIVPFVLYKFGGSQRWVPTYFKSMSGAEWVHDQSMNDPDDLVIR